MDREVLTPCPFCGAGETQIRENGKVWTGMRYSEPASVSVFHWCATVEGQPSRAIERVGKDRASAIAAWNLRAAVIDEALCKRLAALGWQQVMCPACGGDYARGYPHPTAPPGEAEDAANLFELWWADYMPEAMRDHAWKAYSAALPPPGADDEPAPDEVERLRGLAATCYAGLGAECDLPEQWLDVLNAAANGEPFSTEGLLPYTREQPSEDAEGVEWDGRIEIEWSGPQREIPTPANVSALVDAGRAQQLAPIDMATALRQIISRCTIALKSGDEFVYGILEIAQKAVAAQPASPITEKGEGNG